MLCEVVKVDTSNCCKDMLSECSNDRLSLLKYSEYLQFYDVLCYFLLIVRVLVVLCVSVCKCLVHVREFVSVRSDIVGVCVRTVVIDVLYQLELMLWVHGRGAGLWNLACQILDLG